MTIAEELRGELQRARARLGVDLMSDGDLQAELVRMESQRGHTVAQWDPAGSIVINEELLKRDLNDLRRSTFESRAAEAIQHSR